MPVKRHIIIYSHGFGVRRDDNGLLTDIAAALPEIESILFDYFEVNETKKEMLICSFSTQVEKLNQVISETRIANPEAIIDLICHSQGTIIAALAKPNGIRKTILLSPTFDISLEHSLVRYRSKPEAEINLQGVSKIPSSQGLVRIIPKEYWQERLATKPIVEYNALAKKTEIIAIIAKQDELSPVVDLKDLDPRIKLIYLDGDHGFSHPNRDPMIKVIKELLIQN